MVGVYPYIHFNGNAEEAFKFYGRVLGGEIKSVVRFKEVSSFLPIVIGKHEEDCVINIVLFFGKGNVLMGSDTPEVMGRHNENENRSKIMIYGESVEETKRIFEGLCEGGVVEMPLSEGGVFGGVWGRCFGMLRDKYGIEWMVCFDEQKKGL